MQLEPLTEDIQLTALPEWNGALLQRLAVLHCLSSSSGFQITVLMEELGAMRRGPARESLSGLLADMQRDYQ